MVLWLGLAVMTAAVLAVVLRPLMQPARASAASTSADAAVYRDQLRELESERSRGLIADAEADAARVEIARRLLASAEAGSAAAPPATPSPDVPRAVRAVPLALCIAVPCLAVAIYLALGSPGMPGYPLASRLHAPPDATDVAALVAKVEARLREHPEDGQGWDVIAPVYFKQGRYQEAAEAFRQAAALLGESTLRLAGFAEATVLANDGIVTEPARVAYERLAKLEPKRIEPRFWLALGNEQDGRLAAAAEAYAALLHEAEQDAPWRKLVTERLAAVRARLAPQNAAPEGKPHEPGPSGDDIAAAERLSPEARTEFIDQMVSGLAERLRANGGDLAAWQRLIRAYSVLGRKTEARAALADARRGLAGEPGSLEQLEALAKSLGLGS
jgi:cytochrome c-type biogenesis protein CcmH